MGHSPRNTFGKNYLAGGEARKAHHFSRQLLRNPYGFSKNGKKNGETRIA